MSFHFNRLPNSYQRWPGGDAQGFDDMEAPEPPVQNDHLRSLVDALPADERHVVSRVFFGGVTVNEAARELDVTRARADGMMTRGLARIKGWLESGYVPKDRGKVRQLKLPKEKRVAGWEDITPSEEEALLNGRFRGDGRRLDQWISGDPIGYEI